MNLLLYFFYSLGLYLYDFPQSEKSVLKICDVVT